MIELTDKGWTFANSYDFGYRPTNKPNIYVTITRDSDGYGALDGDWYLPIIYVSHGDYYVEAKYGHEVNDLDVLVRGVMRHCRENGYTLTFTHKFLRRFLRLFCGVRDITVTHDAGDRSGEYWVLDTDAAREEWGTPEWVSSHELMRETVSDLKAWLAGDVWAVGYSEMPTDMDPDDWEDSTFIRAFNVTGCWGHIGEDWAQTAAEDESNMCCIPGYDDPDDDLPTERGALITDVTVRWSETHTYRCPVMMCESEDNWLGASTDGQWLTAVSGDRIVKWAKF